MVKKIKIAWSTILMESACKRRDPQSLHMTPSSCLVLSSLWRLNHNMVAWKVFTQFPPYAIVLCVPFEFSHEAGFCYTFLILLKTNPLTMLPGQSLICNMIINEHHMLVPIGNDAIYGPLSNIQYIEGSPPSNVYLVETLTLSIVR